MTTDAMMKAYIKFSDGMRKAKIPSTPENIAECERLMALVYTEAETPKSVFDLPIAKSMWEADAASLGER